MQLLDTTLREGEQGAGVHFSLAQKKEILRGLDDFGTDFIEIGYPAVNEQIRKDCTALAKIKTRAEKVVHARAMIEDVQLAADTGAPWVGIFLSTSKIGMKNKYSFGENTALEKIRDSIKEARRLGLKVRFSAEDATRTELAYLVQAFRTAKKAGAERLSIADSAGCLLPWQWQELVTQLKKETRGTFHVHCHNDLGLANANSVAGLKAGAVLADVSVNGIGERSGIADLAAVSAILSQQFESTKYKTALLPWLAAIVAKSAGSAVPAFQPVTGQHAFSHKAGLHTSAVLKNPKTYETLEPEHYGRERTIIVDQFTSRAAFQARLKELGIMLDERGREEAFLKLKNSPKRWITDADIKEIALSVDANIQLANGEGMEAFVSVYLEKTGHSPNLSLILSSLPSVERVFETSGEADIVAIVQTESVSKLNEVLDRINMLDGVKKTASKIVMRELDGRPVHAPNIE